MAGQIGPSGIWVKERGPECCRAFLRPAPSAWTERAEQSRSSGFRAVSAHEVAPIPAFGSLCPFPSGHTILVLTALAPGCRLCHASPRLSSLWQPCPSPALSCLRRHSSVHTPPASRTLALRAEGLLRSACPVHLPPSPQGCLPARAQHHCTMADLGAPGRGVCGRPDPVRDVT